EPSTTRALRPSGRGVLRRAPPAGTGRRVGGSGRCRCAARARRGRACRSASSHPRRAPDPASRWAAHGDEPSLRSRAVHAPPRSPSDAARRRGTRRGVGILMLNRRKTDRLGSLEQLFAAKEIVIHCGSGGVGKTTTAAAAAAEAAIHLGGKVLVLTV